MKFHATPVLAALVWMAVQLAVHAESMLEIEATQRYPWNGMVHLQCHVSNPYGAVVQSFSIVDKDTGTVIPDPTMLGPSGEPVEEGFSLPSGDSFIVWNAAADLPGGWRGGRFAVTGTIKNRQIVTFEAFDQAMANQVTLSATSSSGGPVTFSVASGPGRISGNTLTFTGEGVVSVVATQAGNDDWMPATASQTGTMGNDALYLVVDLSGGSNASFYPVTYYSSAPSGGFNNNTYKTTKLVLRRLGSGTFKMGEWDSDGSGITYKYNVTLTKPFYIGLFEVTQKQYQLVMGSNPSGQTGDTHPVEKVSWNTIRGNTNWPASSAVSASSFMGRLRARTGLAFDLPTEAQWAYACQAGTTSAYNNGGNSYSDLNKLGRWCGTAIDTMNMYNKTHVAVGGYQANNWGLYDMHGNVFEWCLDWSGSLSNGVTDPKGPSSGTKRVLRGGSYHSEYTACTSVSRTSLNPASASYGTNYSWGNWSNDVGFRLAKP